MKNSFIYLTIAATAVLASCNKESELAGNLNQSFDRNVKISTNIDNERKLSRADFTGTDLSLTLDYGSEDNAVLHTDNRKWKYENSSWTLDGDENMLWKDNSTPVDIYAYSPYINDITDKKNIRFAVQTTQNEDNMTTSDLLGCNKLQYKNEGEPTLSLELSHLLSQVKINLSFGNSVGENPTVESITLNNVATSVIYDATTVTATTDNESKNNVTVSKAAASYSYTAILPAQLLAAGKFLTFTVNGENYSYTIKEGSVPELKKGEILTMNLQVGEQSVLVKSVTIDDWKTENVNNMVAAKKTWADFAVKPSEGKGEIGDPYLIYNAQELAWIAKEVNNKAGGSVMHVLLKKDIDLSGLEWLPIGKSDAATSRYLLQSSVIDGDGHSIIGMEAVNHPDFFVSGFVGYAKLNTEIKNINFVNCTSKSSQGGSGDRGAGVVAGFLKGGCKVINCNVINGFIQGLYCNGGIVGKLAGTSFVYACSFDGTVFASTGNSGSLVGEVNASHIIASYSKGMISKYGGTCGGTIGKLICTAQDNQTKLHSVYTISKANNSISYIGAFSGNYRDIKSCYALDGNNITMNSGEEGITISASIDDEVMNDMNATLVDNTTVTAEGWDKYYYVKNDDISEGAFPYILKKQE